MSLSAGALMLQAAHRLSHSRPGSILVEIGIKLAIEVASLSLVLIFQADSA